MKKTLFSLLTLALTCGFASAIGIDWGVDQLQVSDGSGGFEIADSSNYGVANFELRLMFVGNAVGNETSFTTFYPMSTGLDSGTLGTLPGQDGLVQGSVSVADTTVNGISTWDTGAKYLMVLYDNGSGNYYNVTTDSANTSPITTLSVSGITTGTESFEYFKGTVYQGVQIVPEPGTAALALAGIALLFRRKRA